MSSKPNQTPPCSCCCCTRGKIAAYHALPTALITMQWNCALEMMLVLAAQVLALKMRVMHLLVHHRRGLTSAWVTNVKKSGAAALLQQFEKVMGVEGGAVVGCNKCMGKCKTAPNVRVHNAVHDSLAYPLCIGVGLEDVNTIGARFYGENQQDMGMAAAAT